MTTSTAPDYKTLKPPTQGETITMRDGVLQVPAQPIIPFIEGDGTGPDIWHASRMVFDGAVRAAYGKRERSTGSRCSPARRRRIRVNNWLPDDTLAALDHHLVSIKGPLTTPVGGGFRSLNVALRQKLDLYACVRPVRWFKGVPSPGEGARGREHDHLPREHGGHLRRHRVEGAVAPRRSR